jgi:translation elongation factor P/translation initiation factor 5A
MLETAHLYRHLFLGTLVQITEQQGNWVEFMDTDTNQLRWLEIPIFAHAFEYINEGDPIQLNLVEQRQQARARGLLVPREFLTH